MATSLTNDPVAQAIKEKHAKRQEQKRETNKAFQEAVEQGEKKLYVERTPTGGYVVAFRKGGQLPAALAGTWTSIDRLRKAVIVRYGKDILEM